MWISRSEYNNLLERITKLEAMEKQDEITFGRYQYFLYSSPLTQDRFLPVEWRNGFVCGERVSARELICLIANHFGFKYEPCQAGKLTSPKPEEKAAT